MRDLELDDLHIDSIVDLLKASFTMEDWDKMIIIADKLYSSAQELENEKSNKFLRYKRHVIYYYGFSQLAKGIALQNKGLYFESKKLIENYSDLSWLNDGSKEAMNEVQFFKLFARANMLAVNVLEGNQEYLEPYIEFLKQSSIEEILPGLLNIVEAGMKYNFNVDKILKLFEAEMNKAFEHYVQIRSLYLTKFFYKLSLYYLIHKDYLVAIDKIVKGLQLSNILNDVVAFRRFSMLFESFRHHSTEAQQEQFTLIMKDLLKEELSNEKGIYFDDHYIGAC